MTKPGFEVFDLLKKDHHEAQGGLEDILEGSVSGESSVKKVLNAVMVHMTMEEKILYPQLKAEEETKDLIKGAEKEHQKAKTVIQRLSKQDMDDTEIIEENIEELLNLLNHHILEEENELFPKMEKLCSAEKLHSLYQEMKEMKESIGRQVFV